MAIITIVGTGQMGSAMAYHDHTEVCFCGDDIISNNAPVDIPWEKFESETF